MAVAMINKFMKKIFLSLFGLGLIVSGCEFDDLNPDYPFTVVVKTQSDTARVQNVYVEIAAPIPGNQVWLSGFTNEVGEVNFKYSEAATLSIRASRGSRPDYNWIGCSEIRLLPNQQVIKTVYLEPYDSLLIGCSFD